MKNELIALNGARQDLAALTTEQLKSMLLETLGVSVAAFLEASRIVKELESRGVDLASLRIALVDYFRLIANGQLDPELLLRFFAKLNKLKILATLPLPEQSRFARGGKVLLVEYAPDGSMTHRLADPYEMRPGQLQQVFDYGRIRPETEQQLILVEQQTRARKPVRDKFGRFVLDDDTRIVKLGNHAVPFAELDNLLRECRRRGWHKD